MRRVAMLLAVVSCKGGSSNPPDAAAPDGPAACVRPDPLPIRCPSGSAFADEMYITGNRPSAYAIADLDGDGVLDIVVGSSDRTVGILFGDGQRYVPVVVPTPLGSAPTSVAVGDLDADGLLDIVAGDSGLDQTLVLRNLGMRAFTLLAPVATSRPHDLVLADINGDGKLDLLSATAVLPDDIGVAVLLGVGDGTFGQRQMYDTGAGVAAGPRSLALADVNSDGLVDLVVTNSSDLDGNASVAILRGTQNATFSSPVTYATGLDPDAVQVADLDGDSALDIAVVNSGGSAGTQYDKTLSVFFNSGTGTFSPQTTYSVGHRLGALLVTDRNGDGRPDLVAANMASSSPEILVELINNGNRTFTPQETRLATVAPIAIADLDADGVRDLVTTRGDAALPLLGHTDGRSTTQEIVVANQSHAIETIEDVTGDGHADVISLLLGQLAVSLGHGDGTFGPVVSTHLGDNMRPSAVVIRDLDGDGVRDAAVLATPDGTSYQRCDELPPSILFVLHGVGDGSFTLAAQLQVDVVANALLAGDLDRDGRVDLVTKSNGCIGEPRYGDNSRVDGSVTIARNGATWTTTTEPGLGGSDPKVVDLAGDCRLAVVYRKADGLMYIRRVNDGGTFDGEMPLAVPANVVFADFNEDGRPDIVYVDATRTLRSALGNGDGTFTALPYQAVDVRFDGVADATGDGHLDLIATSQIGMATIRAGHGDGSFEPPRYFNVHPGQTWTSGYARLLVADINSDSLPDLIEIDAGASTALLGRCAP